MKPEIYDLSHVPIDKSLGFDTWILYLMADDDQHSLNEEAQDSFEDYERERKNAYLQLMRRYPCRHATSTSTEAE